jgi:hypothetical protein
VPALAAATGTSASAQSDAMNATRASVKRVLIGPPLNDASAGLVRDPHRQRMTSEGYVLSVKIAH